MRRTPRFCSTSSMSCAMWARPWMQFARANTGGLRVATGATSRARNSCPSYSGGTSIHRPDGGEQAGLLDQPDPRMSVDSLAVHMMDNASALPTCAQQQQQQKLLLIKID